MRNKMIPHLHKYIQFTKGFYAGSFVLTVRSVLT